MGGGAGGGRSGVSARSRLRERDSQVTPDAEGVAEAGADDLGREALKGDWACVPRLNQGSPDRRPVNGAAAHVPSVALAHVEVPTCANTRYTCMLLELSVQLANKLLM